MKLFLTTCNCCGSIFTTQTKYVQLVYKKGSPKMHYRATRWHNSNRDYSSDQHDDPTFSANLDEAIVQATQFAKDNGWDVVELGTLEPIYGTDRKPIDGILSWHCKAKISLKHGTWRER